MVCCACFMVNPPDGTSARPRPAAGPLATLPPDLFCLLEGPAVQHLVTRSATLAPASALGFGVRTEPDSSNVTVFVPARVAPFVLDNLRDNGQMALTAVSPTDNRAVQIKGLWLGERRIDDDDRAFLLRYRDAVANVLNLVGVPRSRWRQVAWWPTVALRMEVREAYVQTPGPGAGKPCEGGP
jgi:hypothetical protein